MRSESVEAMKGPRERLAATVFHLICAKSYERPQDHDEEYFRERLAEAAAFFSRFGERFDLNGKTVLDVGCGYGSSCFYMALNGAKRVVGVDTDEHRLAFAKAKLGSEYASLGDAVEFRTAGAGDGDERFDVVLSQNSFQHYGDPEAVFERMTASLKPDGVMLIGFGPLWKSPYGGPIEFMTRLPWAHLMFPERVIMRERRRFRPDEEAETFSEIRGGMNKMTLRRFLGIVRDAGLRFERLRTNAGGGPRMRAFGALRWIPFLREYFTVNVYGIVRAG